MYKLQDDLLSLKKEVIILREKKKGKIDKYDENALVFIINYLEELIREFQANELKPRSKRFAHLANLIIDRNESLIDSNLGKRLIEVERKYIEYSL